MSERAITYVEALNDVFFIFTLKKFAYSYKEIERSLPKIYLIDNGILTINGITENNRLMENLVFAELIRREENIYYYKSANGKEVDFVILRKGKVKQLIQVCYDLSDLTTKEREIKALLKASKELRCNKLIIITKEIKKEEKIKNKKIEYIPLWMWLLQEQK
mgnify:CR=1 FL=1